MFAPSSQCSLLEKRFHSSVRIIDLIHVLTLSGVLVLVAFLAYVVLNVSFSHYISTQYQ